MSEGNAQRKLRRYLWRAGEVALLILAVGVMAVLFTYLFRYIMPFVIGWFIALLLLPLVRMLERRGLGRLPSVIVVMFSVVLGLGLISVYAIVSLFREASLLSLSASNYVSLVNIWVQDEIALSQDFVGTLPPRVAKELQNTISSTLQGLEQIFRGLMTGLVHSITHIPETVFVLVISFIAAFLILVRRERMYHRFLRLMPPGSSGKIQLVIRDVSRAFLGTVRVQFALMLLSAVLGVIGMLVIGVPYAVLLGILFGIAGLVPVLGSSLLTVPWAAGALLMGDIPLAIKLLLLQLVISTIRHLVEPKILAENVGLDILSTLFGLYVGLQVMGFIGLFLGPIIVIAIKSLLRVRLFSDFFPDVDGDPANDEKKIHGTREQQN